MPSSRRLAKPPHCPRAEPASADTSIRTDWLSLAPQKMQKDSQTQHPPDLRYQSARIVVLRGWVFDLGFSIFSRLPQHVLHPPFLHVNGEHAFIEQRSP